MNDAARGPARVLVVDDHALFRAGLRALIARFPGVEVVGEAGDGVDALAAVERLAPTIVVTDISMPRLDGIELAERLAQTHPEIRLLVVSMHAGAHHVRRALLAGAWGYLAKDCGPDELAIAISALVAGRRHVGAAAACVARLARDAGESLESPADARSAAWRRDGPRALTARQREVLGLVASGRTTKQIARELGVSAKTVDTHRAQIAQRLAIRDIAGLVRFALRHGMVHPDA